MSLLPRSLARIVLAIAVFGAAPSVHASELTLAEVVESARAKFPQMRIAEQELESARGALRAAEGGFDPKWTSSATWEATGSYPTLRAQTLVEQPTPLYGASLFAGYRYGGGKFAVYDGKAETNDYGEARGGIRVPLLRDGWTDRRRTNIAQQEFGVNAAKAGRAQQEVDVVRSASLRYWDWVLAGHRLRVMRAWLALATSRDEQLGERARRGDIPAIDRDENQRTILQRQNAVVGAERDVAMAAFELALFLRDEKGQPSVPKEDRLPISLPEVDLKGSLKAIEERALMQRPDLGRQKAVRDRAALEVDWAENQLRPALDVVLSGSKDFGPGDPSRAKPVLEAGVVLDIPLFNRTARGRAESARQELAKTKEQLRLLGDRISAEVRSLFSAHAAAIERSSIAERELALAKRLAEAEYSRFQLGESTLLTVNIREQAGVEAEFRKIEAHIDCHRAAAALRAAAGEMR